MSRAYENLHKAALFWAREAATSPHKADFVVFTADDQRVLCDNTAMMLTGCRQPMFFRAWMEAKAEADAMNSGKWAAYEDAPCTVGNYATMAQRQHRRFEAAIQALRCADLIAPIAVAA
jgi:hypothetical protein